MTAEFISELAYNALITEVSVTPKPGLVDKNNNGAHSDMQYEHFLVSAEIIKPYFLELCKAETRDLKDIGRKAEKAMFAATGGVNTHKGAIYSLGLLCASLYRVGSKDTNIVCDYASRLALEINQDKSRELTHGYSAFLKHGIKGAKGEAESGFQSVRRFGLPIYERYISADGEEIASVKALLSLMANVRDTNVISRGGLSGESFVMSRAKELLENFSLEKIREFDCQLIQRNISPGGCADLLAVTIFLYNIKKDS